MKIGLTLYVRDEIDIIPLQVNYHLPLVDFFVITDNGSEDGTWEYLSSLKDPKLHLRRDWDRTFSQFVQVNKMVSLCREAGMDWVAHVDADEFLYGDLRSEIDRFNSQGQNFFELPWTQFTLTFQDRGEEPGPLRMLWRMGKEHRDSKAVHKTEGFDRISQGNHWAFMKNPKPGGRLTGLELFHYPNRSWEQWKRKVLIGGGAYQNNTNLPPSMGIHIRTWYQTYLEYGEAGLKKTWESINAMNWSEIERESLVWDPRLALKLGIPHTKLLDRISPKQPFLASLF